MLTPAAKRRRRAAEVASATLSRPFRSPVIRGGRTTPAASPASPERRHKLRDGEPRSPSKGKAAPRDSLTAGTEETTPTSASEQDTTTLGSLAELVDGFLADLDEVDRSLAAEAKTAESSQTSPTAHTTTAAATNTASQDDGLPALIVRWREAARMAADEVFSQVAERVAHAGGVKAWRAMMRGDSWGWGWGGGAEAAGAHGRADGDGDGQGDGRSEDGREGGSDTGDEEEEPAEFTMSMMLASLRVEPGLLGYNEAEERWEDN